MSLRGAAFGFALILLCVPVRVGAADVREDLKAISTKADNVADRTKFIEEQFRQQAVGVEDRSRNSRLENGEVLFLLKDYANAAIVLFDLVDDKGFQESPRWPDAVYTLAESLFQDASPMAAVPYFRKLVKMRHQRYLTPSILRLIEIHGARGEHALIAEPFRVYQEATGGRIPEQVNYIYGKTMLLDGDYPGARKRLAGPAGSGAFRHRGLYSIGVSFALEGDLKKAAEVFTSMLKLEPLTPAEKELRELTHLARGRVYYELGDIDRSIDAYQAIGHRSEYFDDMLFEITWAYVKRAEKSVREEDRRSEYLRAVRALEILLVSNPRSDIAPKGKVLLGNLHLRLGQYGLANKTFEQVIADYQPSHLELARIIRERGDPIRYFREIVAQGLNRLSAEALMPPLALQWASEDETLSTAVGVVKEIRRGESELKTADDLVAKIMARIDGENRIAMFPTLADGQGRAVEIATLADECEQGLLDLETSLLSQAGVSLDRMLAARKKREELQVEVDKLPRTVAAMEERKRSTHGRLGGLLRRVFRLNLELQGFRTTLAAVDTYVAERRNAGDLNAEELGFFQINVPVMRDLIVDMESLAASLDQDLQKLGGNLGLGVAAGSRDMKIRLAYREALAEERKITAGLRTQLTGEGARLGEQIDRVRKRLASSQDKIERYRSELERVVSLKAHELRGQVLVEQARLVALAAEKDRLSADAEVAASGTVRTTLARVKGRFYGIVRSADLGLIDGAWEQKQNETEKIRRVAKAKEKELARIREQFDESLQGAEGGQ
jgi:tetratricopeptide (TPR) repeat protein